MTDGTSERPEEAIEMLEQMVLIREFESRVGELFEDNELPGFVHLYIGQEAVAVGSCTVLEENDYITSTHRGHGHSLAKGLDPDRMMAELFGKEDGYSHGKSGSMHIADLDKGMLGANGIVGAGSSIAVGAGHSIQRQDGDRVCVSFFGEGALAEGVVHESMNMASVFDLPVVFVCENNQYGEMTPAEDQHAIEQFDERGLTYGMPTHTVDGMSAPAVREGVSEAVALARDGGGPSLVMCDTYRYRGHYEGDPTTYRTDEEVERWSERDPIDSLADELLDEGHLTEEEFEAIQEDVTARIDEAVEFARESDLPEPDSAFDGVYTEAIRDE